jgi:hypothetical protein
MKSLRIPILRHLQNYLKKLVGIMNLIPKNQSLNKFRSYENTYSIALIYNIFLFLGVSMNIFLLLLHYNRVEFLIPRNMEVFLSTIETD